MLLGLGLVGPWRGGDGALRLDGCGLGIEGWWVGDRGVVGWSLACDDTLSEMYRYVIVSLRAILDIPSHVYHPHFHF